MELKFKLTKQDISDYLVHSGKQDKFSNRRNSIIRWTFTLGFIIPGIYLFTQNKDFSNLLISVGIGMLCYVLFPLLFKADLFFESKSQVKSTFKSLINVPIKVSLKEGNVVLTVDEDEKVIPLSKLENIVENKTNFYVELGGTLPLILPKSNDDIAKFINEIKTSANRVDGPARFL